MPSDEVRQKSQRIKKRVLETDIFTKSDTILFYVSYGNEVQTHELITESFSLGKTVVVPKSVTDDHTLLLSKIACWDDLEKGAYSILEPKKQRITEIDSGALDLIIVPGVVFDERGHRIGHGKGYYDRLLQNAGHIPTLALAFEIQIVDSIDSEPHDKRIDTIITEKRIIKNKLGLL